MAGTLELQAGRLELESIVRAPLVVIADPVVAASGPAVTPDELGGAGCALLERPGGSVLAVANPAESGLFVWAGRDFVAVVADPDRDTPLDPSGELTLVSGRLVVGAPDVVAAWGADVDTGDGSAVRARVHRGRQRLGLIVVAHCPPRPAPAATGAGAAAVTFSTCAVEAPRLPLAG